MQIRTARASDRREILALWLDLIQHHRDLDPDRPGLPGLREMLLQEIGRGLRSRRCRLAVVEDEGSARGFVFAEIERPARPTLAAPPPAWIHELWVDPAWRRRGAGKALVAFADAFLRERGADSVWVRVETANRDGRRFWSRCGFEERACLLLREVDPSS